MPTDHSAARSILKSITIRLKAEAGQHGAEARHELALNALAAALLSANNSSAIAWTLQPASTGEPLLYHLTPLQEQVVLAPAAWEMTCALRDQPAVAGAEPTFITARGDRGAANGMP
jgi:hypothetical protein